MSFLERISLDLPKTIALSFSVLSLLVLPVNYCFNKKFDGTLIVLTLTLITLIWYTYYTYRLAHKKEEPSIAATIHYLPEYRDIRIIVSNLTNRYAAVKLWIQVKINDDLLINDLGAYCGDVVWHLTPRFTIDGHIPLENLISRLDGKTFEQIVDEIRRGTDHQLKLSLQVTWEDEDRNEYETPKHYWYFDFIRNNFVYHVPGYPDL